MKAQDMKAGVRVMTREYAVYTVKAVREVKQGFYVTVQPAGARHDYCLLVPAEELRTWELHRPVNTDHV